MLNILEHSAAMAREGIMKFTCRTAYDQKALTAAGRALRKTIRAQHNLAVRHRTWLVIALAAMSFWLSWGTAWQMVLSCVVISGLLAVNWKGDAIDAYVAKRWGYPNMDSADAAFYSDHFQVNAAAAESKWQYDKILALAETGEYLVLVMGKNHALAMEKATLEGGISEFRRFLEEKSGRSIENIGR